LEENDSDGGSGRENGKQVIARAAAVLRALENKPAGVSLSQLAKDAGLPRTTVHRIVAALEAQQLVVQHALKVRLGPALVRLAASVQTDFAALARPFVEALGRKTRETVVVSVRRGARMISLDRYDSDQELRVVSQVGTAYAMHCTAHGKAVLAKLPDEEIRQLLGAQYEKRTAATITDPQQLLASVREAREAGYALDFEENARGVFGIGVHVRSGLAEDYALSLALPEIRFHEDRDRLCAAILQCKAEIEAITAAFSA
jgi:IclR family acetate operon transcriptional repressor